MVFCWRLKKRKVGSWRLIVLERKGSGEMVGGFVECLFHWNGGILKQRIGMTHHNRAELVGGR